MSDHLKGFVVTFEINMRDDDAESIAQAIRMVRGVLSVSPVIANHEDDMTRRQVRHELTEKLFKILK